MMAKALIVSSAVPTSLSSVLLAVEFDNEPEFASQVGVVINRAEHHHGDRS